MPGLALENEVVDGKEEEKEEITHTTVGARALQRIPQL